ncbi:MAG: hypothetical protein VXW25_05735, partial [Pseudomonadota bacterium]|nr:hypothetical protein [Pseudomonadota bacterium]
MHLRRSAWADDDHIKTGLLEMGAVRPKGHNRRRLVGPEARDQRRRLLAPQPLYFCVPGVVIGVSILLILQRYHHFLVLPALLLASGLATLYAATCIPCFTLRFEGALGAVMPQPSITYALI